MAAIKRTYTEVPKMWRHMQWVYRPVARWRYMYMEVSKCDVTCNGSIDSLHGDVTFGHFHIRPFGRRHVGGQKCFAVIERKALNVLLIINTSDYSNKTCMERFMCLYLTNMVVLLEQSFVIDMISAFLSVTAIHFWPPTWWRPNGCIRKCPNVTSPCNGSIMHEGE